MKVRVKPRQPRLRQGDSLTRGLVGAYPFVSSGGVVLRDISGHLHNGVLTNGPTWVSSRYGYSLSFDGSNDYVALSNVDEFKSASGTGMTVFAWVKTNTIASGGRFVFSARKADAGCYFALYRNGSFLYAVGATNARAAAVDVRFNEKPFVVNQWHHIGVQRDEAGVLYGWMDGVRKTGSALVGDMTDQDVGPYIGGQSYSSGLNGWDGEITDVRIWNRFLTYNESISMYHERWRLYIQGELGVVPLRKTVSISVPFDSSRMSKALTRRAKPTQPILDPRHTLATDLVAAWPMHECAGLPHELKNDITITATLGVGDAPNYWRIGDRGPELYKNIQHSSYATWSFSLGTHAALKDLPSSDFTISALLRDETKIVSMSATINTGFIFGTATTSSGWAFMTADGDYTDTRGIRLLIKNATTDAEFISEFGYMPHPATTTEITIVSPPLPPISGEYGPHILATAVWDAATKTARLFINGRETEYTTQTTGVGSYNSDAALAKYLGGIQGRLGDIRIWRRKLTDTEIARLPVHLWEQYLSSSRTGVTGDVYRSPLYVKTPSQAILGGGSASYSSVEVVTFLGAAATQTAITSSAMRYKWADDSDASIASPMRRPGLPGTLYSWRKHTKVNWLVHGSTTVTNLRWFYSGSTTWPAGVTLLVAASASYAQAGTADQTTAIGTTDASTYTTLAPLTVTVGTVLASSATGIGSQSFVATQLAVDETTEAGTTENIEYTYRWTEA